jgi:hypothetical protein
MQRMIIKNHVKLQACTAHTILKNICCDAFIYLTVMLETISWCSVNTLWVCTHVLEERGMKSKEDMDFVHETIVSSFPSHWFEGVCEWYLILGSHQLAFIAVDSPTPIITIPSFCLGQQAKGYWFTLIAILSLMTVYSCNIWSALENWISLRFAPCIHLQYILLRLGFSIGYCKS